MARIAYLGNFRWPWCTERHVGQALAELGHHVSMLQEDKVTVDQIETAAHGSELVLFTRTWGCHNPRALTGLWETLRCDGIPTASYHLDLYVGLERENTIPGDPFWLTDCVFHPDGNPATAKRLAELGVHHHVLPPAVAADHCFIGRYSVKHDHEIVFVGSANPYGHANEWPFRDRLVTYLADTYGPVFAHYGPGGLPTVRNGMNGPTDYTLNDLYRSARVVAGDCIHRDGYVSDRLTETLGRGGLLVFPHTETVDAMGYQPGEHYIGYEPGNIDSFGNAVTFALALDDDQAEQIRRNAVEHTYENHTFRHRMQTLLDTMGVE